MTINEAIIIATLQLVLFATVQFVIFKLFMRLLKKDLNLKFYTSNKITKTASDLADKMIQFKQHITNTRNL